MRSKLAIFAILIAVINCHAKPNYIFKLLIKEDLQNIRTFFIEQRLAFFREYPYLYEGDLTHEEEYFDWLSKLEHSAIAVAYLGGNPVAFLSGTSFMDFGEHLEGSIEAFEKVGENPEEFYYFSEVIVLPEYRGQHLSQKLFQLFENHLVQLGYKSCCFVTESHEAHPLKPSNYISLENLWLKLNYAKSSIMVKHDWPTIQSDGSIKVQDHELIYWLKTLN